MLIVSVVVSAVLLAGCGSAAPAGTSSVTAVAGVTATQSATTPAEAMPEIATSAATVTVPATPVASHGEPVSDYVSFVDALRVRGITVKPAGDVSHEFFAVAGQVLNVPGGDIQVFEYADEAAAQQDAQKVGPDGSAIGTSMVTWVASPHFYRVGKLIVLYVGNDARVTSALEILLGKQFAGR
ncbi:MAG: hypothetical protein M1546_26605 [Chloroflexi bacterium]|nr:hypothetical protein [Chloroflexota bacterium]